MQCKECEEKKYKKIHTRRLKDGRILQIPTRVGICEHCPPNSSDRSLSITDWANRLCRTYPERVIVLRECPCEKKKITHHPDYRFPFQVERLCYTCHGAEHKRLRSLAVQAANNSSIPADQSIAQNSLGR
jgi:hypothetical protein